MQGYFLVRGLPLALPVAEGGEEVQEDVDDEEQVHGVFVEVEEGVLDLEGNEVGHQSQVVDY